MVLHFKKPEYEICSYCIIGNNTHVRIMEWNSKEEIYSQRKALLLHQKTGE